MFPSLYDCSSLVQIEAASQGTPTLFLEGASTGATVTAEKNGYFSENDVEAYANKIIEIFSDENKYKEVCKGAIEDLYTHWEKHVEQAFNEYKKFIENN